ncbi:MAG TPA: chorismate mutase, partial [Reyranella sp.]
MDAPKLNALRQEIDAIDGDLHGLIRRRAELVGEISAAKPDGGLSLRPGREAQIMRKRLGTHDGRFPAAAVYRMWREMMSAFALMQTPALKVAVCRPADQPGYWDLARDHFGCQVPMVGYESPAQGPAEVRANPTTIGVVPAPIDSDTAPWWPLLSGGD